MTTPSPSTGCSPSEPLEAYRRLCLIAAEYTRAHPDVAVAVALTEDGRGFFGVAKIGEDRPRRFFDAEPGVSREALIRRFDEAAGLPPTLPPDDEWDW